MNTIIQTRLSKDGLSEFRKALRVEADMSMREIKENGFKGVSSQWIIWRYKNIELKQSRRTCAYVAVESHVWNTHPAQVASLAEYKARASL